MKTTYLLLISLTLTACASPSLVDSSGQDLFAAEKVYLKTNLHPDTIKSKLYSINYQREGLIPACSEIELVELGRKRLIFKVRKTGITYHYDHHRAAGDFATHLKDYFSAKCDKDKIKKLSKLDKKGIKVGKAFKGMTRQGVIYAIGFPPKHRTPDLDASEWIYWTNRFKTMAVRFNSKGRVKSVN